MRDVAGRTARGCHRSSLNELEDQLEARSQRRLGASRHLGAGQVQRAAIADGAAEDVPVPEVKAGLHEGLRLVVIPREGVRVPVAESAELPLLQVQGGPEMSCSSRGAHQF